jgi:cyclic-di-GMP-binding protein
MPADSSFDVVSEYDQQELVNAVDQTLREIRTRYDLKDSKSELLLEKVEMTITAPAEMQLTAIKDILESKMVRRGLSLKILKFGKMEDAAGGMVRQKIALQKGINQDHAKEITKMVRDRFPKAKAMIQGDAVRVSSKSKDELQGIIQMIKAKDWPIALQFTNYR